MAYQLSNYGFVDEGKLEAAIDAALLPVFIAGVGVILLLAALKK